jgi:arabinofuranosyltransferase
MRATRSCVTASRRDDLLVALAAVVPLAWLLLRERVIAGAAGFPLDDSWIHLHFARNLAAGAGFVYNPGQPVAGSTAPLWTLLLGAGAAVAGASLAMAKTLGVASGIAAALVVRRAAIAFGAVPATAVIAAVSLLWTGAFAWGALSGMEVTFAALLVAASLLALARDATWTTAVASALAALARPEAIVLTPLLALARPPTARRMLIFAAVTLAVVAPFVAFSYATVGRPLPATAVAKIEGGLLGWLGGLREPAAVTWLTRPRDFGLEWLRWLLATHPLLPLALPAAFFAWRRCGRALGLVSLALIAHPLAMALLAPYRGPAFQEGRYSTHLLPLAVIVLAAAAAKAFRAKPVVLAFVLLISLMALAPAAERYAWGVQNINAMQVHLGRWLDAHAPPSATLAVNDIGAIAFFSRRPVLDLMGLVTPDILPYRREGETGVMTYVAQRCPDYVVIFPTWFPLLAARRDVMTPVYSVRLARNEVSGGPEMVVYRLTRCAV